MKQLAGLFFIMSLMSPISFAEGHKHDCKCDKACSEKCEKGEGKSCKCKECDCAKADGHCEKCHGKHGAEKKS